MRKSEIASAIEGNHDQRPGQINANAGSDIAMKGSKILQN
jgi:hypothetical protein